MSNSSQKFKILLGVLIPIFVILIVLGFAFVMIGYQVGSQVDDPVIN
jgi:hypothetical protein